MDCLRHPRGERRERARAGLRKLSVGLAIKASLCCAWFVCCAAHASDQQVIVEGGQRAGDIVRTSGHDVPLLQALEKIVPTTYSVNVPNAGAWADVPVSWRAGSSVVRVLGEVLSVNPTLQARVDTNLRLVTVTAHARRAADDVPSPSAAPAALNAASSAKASAASASLTTRATVAGTGAAVPPLFTAGPAPGASTSSLSKELPAPTLASTQASPPSVTEAASSAVAPAASPEHEQTEWQMRTSDGSVRNALARWASEAGWQFIWDVPTDFAVDATATVHGTLEEALRQVTNALAGSQVPIQVVLYKRNRVLRVVPKGAS
jgi:Toxin co-regulated pilus biosynthesis protein Q